MQQSEEVRTKAFAAIAALAWEGNTTRDSEYRDAISTSRAQARA